MSSNDFDGSPSGPGSGRGADEQGAGAPGAGAQGSSGGGASYPAPEGWSPDGVWRDSAIDANYETSMQQALRPTPSHPQPGYSYWADGQGWQNNPGASAAQAAPLPGSPAPDATSVDSTRAVFGAGAGPTAVFGAPGGDPTAVYRGGPGVPPGPGAGGYGAAGMGGPGWAGGPGGPGRPGGSMGPGGPYRPQGPRGRRKGDWWRHWTWKKALVVTGGVFAVFFITMLGTYQYLSSSASIPVALASANYQDTTVYYSDGKTVLGTFGLTNRQDLTYQQIPQQLQNAFVAAEDKGFWTEGGISPTGILRAALHDVVNGGSNLNGGSTITQEFVRNYYDGVGTQQTASRKVKEIFIAQKLATVKSKQWILTHYMNLILMGQGSYGVEAAAETYFGVPVSKLTIAQDAVLAGLAQAPSAYSAPSNRSLLVQRWRYVLQQMVNDNYITQAQVTAMKFPAMLTDTNGAAAAGTSINANGNDPWAPYILSVVENELTGVDNIPQQQLETGGLKVVTTVNHSMEVEMYKAVDENIAAIKAASGAPMPSWVRIGAELQNPGNGQILAMYPGPGQSMSARECKAWDCDLNTAIYSREQVGSSFKPYVLSAAVADGMNVKTSTLNSTPELCVPPDSSPMAISQPKVSGNVSKSASLTCPSTLPGYFPVENDGGEIIGTPKGNGIYASNVQTALAQSSNTAFTDLAHRATTTKVIQMAQNYGVNIAAFPNGSNLSNMVGQVGLALGTASLTVNEQTTMLSTIANNGVYHAGHVVGYWQLPNGPKQTPQIETHGVLDPSNPTTNAQLDSQVQYAMEKTTVSGTGTSAAAGLGSRPIIAKTGTTSSGHAGFFIGAIAQYSLVVGMFTQSQSQHSTQNLAALTGGGYGGYWPAKIWNTFAQAKFANLPVENFQNPVFSGSAWNQIGKLAQQKPVCYKTVRGQKVPTYGKGCPTPTPTPSQTCSYNSPSNPCTVNGTVGRKKNGNVQIVTPSPTATATCLYAGDPTCAAGQTPSPYPTTSSGTTSSPSAPATAGVLALPGSLLLTGASRRRKRRKRGRKAE